MRNLFIGFLVLLIMGGLAGGFYALWYHCDVYKITDREVIDHQIITIEDGKGVCSLEAEDVIWYLDGDEIKKCQVGCEANVYFDPNLEDPVLRQVKTTGITRGGRTHVEYKPGLGNNDLEKVLVFKDSAQYLDYLCQGGPLDS